jgi:hypothetical protein
MVVDYRVKEMTLISFIKSQIKTGKTLFIVLSLLLLCVDYSESFDFHKGRKLINTPPYFGDFFYAIYDVEENRHLLEGDKTFLKDIYLKSEGVVYDTSEFRCDRILKMIGIDSVYVTIYTCSKNRPGHKYSLILSDMWRNRKWDLAHFNIEEFNNLFKNSLKEFSSDLGKIAGLYVVLLNLDKNLFFCESRSCLNLLFLDFELYPLSHRNQLIDENFNEFLEKHDINFDNLIDKDSDGNIIINKYVYFVPYQEFYRYSLKFNNILIDCDKTLLWKFQDDR